MTSRVPPFAITILLSVASIDCGGDEPKQEYPVTPATGGTSSGGRGGGAGSGTAGSAAGSGAAAGAGGAASGAGGAAAGSGGDMSMGGDGG
jgi:hypothetical protein